MLQHLAVYILLIFFTALYSPHKLASANQPKHEGRDQAQHAMISLPNEIYAAILGVLLGAWVTYYFARKLAADQLKHMLVVSKAEAARGRWNSLSPRLR